MSARTRRSRGVLAACSVVLLACLAACSRSDDPFADGCVARVRYQGDVFRDVGFSSLAVKRAGRAQILSCPRDGAARAKVWSYPGRDPHDVLAIHLKGHVYRVMVAERLPASYVDGLRAAHVFNAGSD